MITLQCKLTFKNEKDRQRPLDTMIEFSSYYRYNRLIERYKGKELKKHLNGKQKETLKQIKDERYINYGIEKIEEEKEKLTKEKNKRKLSRQKIKQLKKYIKLLRSLSSELQAKEPIN